ncbi:MAG: radical SAM protein [Desulfomonilaceae bacterium]
MNSPDLPDTIRDSKLKTIAKKVIDGKPVSRLDAKYMLTTNNVLDLGKISNFVRRELHGDVAYYGVNMNLNFTNVCELRCPLCAFSRDEGDKDAYTLSLEQIEQRVKDAVATGIDEVHIVGGLNPNLPLDYFVDMIRLIKRIKPDIFVVAFTAVEIDYFARKNKSSVRKILQTLIDAGIGAMPGGGAEIFSPHVRDTIAPSKIPGSRWLQVMRTAHDLGLKTNVTMLYNHIEEVDDIVDHLARIRKLQDETHGFKTLVPLLFHGENTKIEAKRPTSTGYDDIRIFATSRIFLHNVPHIKALWMYLGDKMAQVLLKFGVDDFAATYHNEKVVHAAGAKTPAYGSEPFLKRLIENAGFRPVRTTASYWIQ